RAVTKEAKGDSAGAAADYKRARELDPELVSEESGADSTSNRAAGNGGAAGTTARLLDGKLKLDIPPDFSRDPDDPKNPKTVAKFSGPDGAWGEVLRGTHGLTPDKLDGYLKMRVAGKKDYSHSPVYTRFLTTSYTGQLLEITFTSNLNTNSELK